MARLFLLSNRRWRQTLLRVVLLLGLVFVLVDISTVLSVIHHQEQRPVPTLAKKERVYIASIHWNNGDVLRSNWNRAVLNLVTLFGRDNIYISIFESGSWDDSKEVLRELDAELNKLGVRRTVLLDPTTHADEIATTPGPEGWIETPRGRKELRRIPYLSRLRNLSLKPMWDMANNGEKFDKVLFLNDVVFDNDDVSSLLNTNGGKYAAACSLDFARPPNVYDTFVLRDSEGQQLLTQDWPYFRSSESRNALLRRQPVPVRSCWNGIVVFDAKPFYAASGPLKFRGLPDTLAQSHIEASECCLIHADNPLSAGKGVWLNPEVCVGYNREAYESMKHSSRTFASSLIAIWKSRFLRWTTKDLSASWYVFPRVRAWQKKSTSNYEPGSFCAVNEMQVLIANGWAHL